MSVPGTLLRFETIDGLVRWRVVRSFDHRTLCAAAGLYPGITQFDVPTSLIGGSGGGSRKKEGVILQDRDGAGFKPIGTITVVEEGERIREEDWRARVGA